jgi:ADP-ribosylglycohydrolase
MTSNSKLISTAFQGIEKLNSNKKFFKLSYQDMSFMLVINFNLRTEKEEVNEIKNFIPKKYISISENEEIKINKNIYQVISIKFKNYIEMGKDEKGDDINLNQNTIAEKFCKLVLLLLNKNPDQHHNFLFNEFTQILNNKTCVKIFESNVYNTLEILKNFNNRKVNINGSAHPKLLYYSISSIISAFIGDSMGSYVEFSKPSMNNHNFLWTDTNRIFGTSRGQVTDDSEMALSLILGLCDSLYSSSDSLVQDFLAYYYGLWYASEPFDLGITTRKALIDFENVLEKNGFIYFSQRKENKYYDKCKMAAMTMTSLSNGFLMRHTPLTFYNFWKFENQIISLLNFEDRFDSEKNYNTKTIHENFNKIIELISPMNEIDVSITHSNLNTLFFTNFYDLMIMNILYCHSRVDQLSNLEISCKVYNRMKEYFNYIFTEKFDNSLYSTDTFPNLFDFIERIDKLSLDLSSISTDFKQFNDEIIKFIFSENIGTQHTGFFLHAIKLCLFFLKFYDNFDQVSKKTENGLTSSDPFEYFMFLICDLGGDTDTNCCIVGGVIGALVGFSSYNEKYLKDTMNFLPVNTNVQRPVLFSPGLSIFMALQIFRKLKVSTNDEEVDKNLSFKFNDLLNNENKINHFESLNVILQLFFINLEC